MHTASLFSETLKLQVTEGLGEVAVKRFMS